MPKTHDGGIDRRRLLQSSMMLLGVPPCCATQQVPPESISYQGDVLVLDLNKAAGLGKVGWAGAVVDSARKLNIIVARTDRDRFVAIDRTCTHGGAQCTYNHSRKTLRCTSLNHAEYDLEGRLLHGRTHGNLRVYEVRRIGSRLEVKLENRT